MGEQVTSTMEYNGRDQYQLVVERKGLGGRGEGEGGNEDGNRNGGD
jgi:hypothetical protein